MLIKNLIYIVILSFLSGCAAFYHPATLELDVPDGPREYKAGWYDGCRSSQSLKRFSNGMAYKVTQGSGVYQHDQLYQSGYSNGWFSCYMATSDFVTHHPFERAPLD